MVRYLGLKVQYLIMGAALGFMLGHSMRAEKRELRTIISEMKAAESRAAVRHAQDLDAVKGKVSRLEEEAAEQDERHRSLQRQHHEEKGGRLAHEHALQDALQQLRNGESDDGEDSAREGSESAGAGGSDAEESNNDAASNSEDSHGRTDDDADAEDDLAPKHYEVEGFSLPKLRAKDKTIILIPANLGYIQFALNLVCSLRRLKIRHYVLLAMDNEVLREFQKRRLPVYVDPDLPFVTSKSAQWAEANFHKLVCTKLVPVINLLKLGYNVLFTDADIVWRRDPFPFVKEDLSLTYSIGSCHKSLEDNADLSKVKDAKLNTGFYHARAEESVITLFQRAYQICRKGSLTGDQPAINSAIHQDIASKTREYTYGFFSGCLFANGCVYFKRLCGNTTAYNPVLVHANFVVGRRKKMRSLQKNGLWDLTCHPNPDEYALPEPEKKKDTDGHKVAHDDARPHGAPPGGAGSAKKQRADEDGKPHKKQQPKKKKKKKKAASTDDDDDDGGSGTA